jgi:ferredoxin-NADP reductase
MMMRVKLLERRQEAPDVLTLVFDLEGQDYGYTAGQYAFFELDNLALYDPRGKRRHFTLSSSPSEVGIVQFTTRLRGSGFKETLRQGPLGMEVTLQNPRGDFVLPQDRHRPLVFLGGGIGVTPFRSMMRYATDGRLPTAITLLYSAQTPAGIVFRREFERMTSENPNLKIVTTITSPGKAEEPWSGETGIIDAEKIRAHVENVPGSIFYTCGPAPMMQAMVQLLKSMGIGEEGIRFEEFTGY